MSIRKALACGGFRQGARARRASTRRAHLPRRFGACRFNIDGFLRDNAAKVYTLSTDPTVGDAWPISS